MRQTPRTAHAYPRFAELDGTHPFKEAAPRAYVDYAARRRHGGEVVFFNFPLAKEMGLVPPDHPQRLNRALEQAILDAFGLVIINEYDLLQRRRFPEADIHPNRYMATRYLQLQHAGKLGQTSGDGRGIWNGAIEHGGVRWDVSSCGTGVTCLAPATAEHVDFFRTGNPMASYGCGTATLEEGLSTVLMSEVFHRNGIETERVLALIAYPQGQAIHVRAAKSLLRPSHFFVHLKQGDRETLRAVVDHFIDRQIANGDWPRLPGARRRYAYLAERTARHFATAAAIFESEYVFCWLDWDGDNVLANGGIIDYGSVRQLGLFHREYRFDDGPRWSTTLTEQRGKARHLVQVMAQIRDFLVHGEKPALKSLRRDPVLALFDRVFARAKDERLLRKAGFEPDQIAALLRGRCAALERFRSAHGYFERARAARGPQKVPDGLSWNAIFSTRDLLRELSQRYRDAPVPIPARELIDIAASSYASRRDRALTPHRRRMARAFQRAYLDLITVAARRTGAERDALLEALARRAAHINRPARITGDAVDYATSRLLRQRRQLTSQRFHEVVQSFVDHQDLSPEAAAEPDPRPPKSAEARALVERLLSDVEALRHGL